MMGEQAGWLMAIGELKEARHEADAHHRPATMVTGA